MGLVDPASIADYEAHDGERRQPAAHPTVLFTGRLAVEKNVDVLIEAISVLPAELDAHLEIVGDGEQRPAPEKLARALVVAHRVRFLGYVSAVPGWQNTSARR